MQVNWRDGHASREVFAQFVTTNYFDCIGGKAELGRLFTGGETRVTEPSGTVVISHRFWQQRLQADPAVLSRKLVINGFTHVILGVLPPSYRSVVGLGADPDVYLPANTALLPTLLNGRDGVRFAMIGRLHPNQTREQAAQALLAQGESLRARFAPEERRFAAQWQMEGIRDIDRMGSVGNSPLLMFVVVLLVLSSLVLLVACANVASLLLVRATARRREIAIRFAIGASRSQIVAQLLAEGAVLSALGTCAGLALCGAVFPLLGQFPLMLAVPVVIRPAVDLTFAAFAVAMGLLCTIVSSLVPALQSGRGHLTSALTRQQLSTGPRWITLRAVLVAGQIALSFVLLLCAALSYRGVERAQGLHPGFDADNTLAIRVRHPQSPLRVHEVLEQLSSTPGVDSVAAAERVPLTFSGQTTIVHVEGTDASQVFQVRQSNVTADYFRTLGIGVIAGQDFRTRDRRRVLLVNQLLANRHFPHGRAVGRRLMYRVRNGPMPFEIIGVVADTKYFSLGEAPQEIIYLPLADEQETLHLFARTAGPARDQGESVRKRLQALAPAALVEVEPLRASIRSTLLLNQIGAFLLAAIGSLGLGLAVTGLYGVLSYAVSLRTPEFGVRLALGASRLSIMATVVRHSLFMVLSGACLGIALGLAGTTSLSVLLVSGINVYDPLCFGAVLLLLVAVGTSAGLVPALRVLRIDPLRALRFE